MIITPELEYPIVCTGVRKAMNGCLKLELINMNSEWRDGDGKQGFGFNGFPLPFRCQLVPLGGPGV